jgi:hypothetical protein
MNMGGLSMKTATSRCSYQRSHGGSRCELMRYASGCRYCPADGRLSRFGPLYSLSIVNFIFCIAKIQKSHQ